MRLVRNAVCIALVGLAIGSASGACSLAFPASAVQCTHDTDCTARGPAFAGSVCLDNACVAPTIAQEHDAGGGHKDAGHDAGQDATHAADAPSDVLGKRDSGPWGCVGFVDWPAETTAPITVTQPYYDGITMAALPGLTVVPCARIDSTCTAPLAPAQLTNDAGVVSFPLTYGYGGYLQTTWDAGLPTLVYVNPPAYTSTPQVTAPMLTYPLMAQLVQAFTTTSSGSFTKVDPSLGHVLIGTFDCAGNPGPGTKITFDHSAASVVSMYFANGLPSATATETDTSGFYAAFNFPPGPVTATMTLATTGQVLGTTSVFVRAATISGVNITPSPPIQ